MKKPRHPKRSRAAKNQVKRGDPMTTPYPPQEESTLQQEPVVEPPEGMEEPQMAEEATEIPIDPALAEALAKQEEYLNMAQRVQADFENYRRRNQNLRKEAFDDGARSFATTLLDVLDNLERAITASQNTPDEALKSGVEMVYRQLCEAFLKRGITPIDRLGEKFDPNLENAVMQGTPEEGEPGTVCAVFQKGYQMEGSVLRHAMVKVVPE